MLRCLALIGGLVAVAAACNQPGGPSPTAARADCSKAAELLANFEIGTAVAPEARAPVVAKHRAACESANLTVAEATCIANASSTWQAIDCAPRMFPQRATSGDCAAVSSRMREAILTEMPKHVGSAGHAMVDKMLPIIESSCREDNWPAGFRDCIVASKPGDMASFNACESALPNELRVKLGERLRPLVKETGEPPPAAPVAPGSDTPSGSAAAGG